MFIGFKLAPLLDLCKPGHKKGFFLWPRPSEVNNIRTNVGAYGGTAEASKSPSNWRSIADLTNDWAVDYKDLKVFTDYWLDSGQCIPSDLNRNQFVDLLDFAIFAKNWLWEE